MVAGVVVEVVLGDLVQLSSDGLGDVFDDRGMGFKAGEVGLVEGEDAFDFDAEGYLVGGVDHLGCFWWIDQCVAEVLGLVQDGHGERV